MCDTRALADEICDYISAPFGIGLNEHVRKSVALKIAEALKPSHNSAMDAICALDEQICKYSSDNVTVINCSYSGECPHKQHQ